MRKKESGASAVEYVLLAAIVIAVIVGVVIFGIKTMPETSKDKDATKNTVEQKK